MSIQFENIQNLPYRDRVRFWLTEITKVGNNLCIQTSPGIYRYFSYSPIRKPLILISWGDKKTLIGWTMGEMGPDNNKTLLQYIMNI